MSESQFHDRLKSAVDSVEVPPELRAQVRASLDAAGGRRWALTFVPGMAAALVCAVGLSLYHNGQFRYTRASREAYIGSVSSRVAAMMRVGLGDHIHCSVFAKPPATKPDQIAESLGPEFKDLAPIAQRYVPEQYRLTLAHRCSYHGRHFVHLSFMNDSHLVSLLVTKRGDGESFEAEKLLPALVQSGIPMYQANVQRFAISGFETRDYLVYMVSDLAPEENLQILTAMAPSVHAMLERL
jgi:hypothetical protein